MINRLQLVFSQYFSEKFKSIHFLDFHTSIHISTSRSFKKVIALFIFHWICSAWLCFQSMVWKNHRKRLMKEREILSYGNLTGSTYTYWIRNFAKLRLVHLWHNFNCHRLTTTMSPRVIMLGLANSYSRSIQMNSLR